MNEELQDYIQRVDPQIYEALSETDNFEEIVAGIKEEADEIQIKIATDHAEYPSEYVAYLFAMQNRALTQMIEEVEELRPAIRFITSVLVGNTDPESDEDA